MKGAEAKRSTGEASDGGERNDAGRTSEEKL